MHKSPDGCSLNKNTPVHYTESSILFSNLPIILLKNPLVTNNFAAYFILNKSLREALCFYMHKMVSNLAYCLNSDIWHVPEIDWKAAADYHECI